MTVVRFISAAAIVLSVQMWCSAALITVTGLTGRFFDPVGGTFNDGIGTDFFQTGEPITFSNFIIFVPEEGTAFTAPNDFEFPSTVATVGKFIFGNGVTTLGTSASGVDLDFVGIAENNVLDPPIVRPMGGSISIDLFVTPNDTGDPVKDGDLWVFPRVGTMLVPENAIGEATAFGRLIPRNVASPPERYDLELVALEPVDDTILFVPPIPVEIRDTLNLTSNGVLPVSIISTPDLDAQTLDPDSFVVGDPILIDDGASPVSPIRSVFEDVTDDGILDLSMKFSIPAMLEAGVLDSTTEELLLTGTNLDGLALFGSDFIRIVPKKGALNTVPEPSSLVMLLAGLLMMRRCVNKPSASK